jgi:hypothetical protein
MIKKIAIGAGPQRMDDAVAWVDISTPDQMDPDKMTVDQLRAAPAHIQAEAIRRLNWDPKPPDPRETDADGRPAALGAQGQELWHQPWAINAEGDPDFQELMTKHAKEKSPK